MKALLYQWITSNRVMLVNTGSLVGTTAVTSVLGFVYWWVAARLFLPEAVGIASASVSAMILLATFSMLGMGTLLITELPRQPEQKIPLISTALVVAGVTGGVTGLLFAVIAPYASAEFDPLKASLADSIVFAAGVSSGSITLVLDQALIGILRGNLQFWRNAFFAVAKLILLLVAAICLSYKVGMTIYTTWTLGMVLSLAASLCFAVRKRGWQGRAWWPQWRLLGKLGRASLEHHFLNLTLLAPTLALPVLVTVLLSAEMNAWFYVSWMIANFMFVVPGALTTVLHAMNSAKQSSLGYRARVTIGLALVTGLFANVLLQLGTKQVLELFGSSYAEQGVWCLRILGLAVFPLIIKNHYVSFCRIQDRVTNAVLAILPGGILELAAAALGAYLGGLAGLSLGWVIGITVEAVFMFRTVYQAIRPMDSSLRVGTQENSIEVEPIWLVDTITLATIPLRNIVGVRPLIRTGHVELELIRSKQHNGKNSYDAKPRLRPIRLEQNLPCARHMHTTDTERTLTRTAEKPAIEIPVSMRESNN